MLSRAKFLVIGAGGLGCPALLGLLAGGARRMVIVDNDTVDLSNLPRQVLYATSELGVSKIDAACQALRERCPAEQEIELTALPARLDPDALEPLLAAHQPSVVLECSDSPLLKFAVHDACVRQKIPVVVGGVVTWGGQAMAVDSRLEGRACYRCIFEAPPPAELSPACASVGVFGPVAGTVGQTMALLALALLDPAQSPAGSFTHFDLLRGSVRRLAPKPRPDCISCGCNFDTRPA